MRVILLMWVMGCAQATDPCDAMCTAAAQLYGSCLSDWDADWTAAGYSDESDFIDACDTWAWEMRLLESEHGGAGAVDATCSERTVQFSDGTCSDFTETDWNEMPW